MNRVLARLAEREQELARAPLFAFLADRSIDPHDRLAFAPGVAHFVLSFADLYAFVLPEEPPRDRYQELVNAHTREDETHWMWFLKDLEKLGMSPRVSYTDALRYVWGPATRRMRLLSYAMCRLGMGASSLQKLVLVKVIESAGKVTVGGVSEVGRELGAQTGLRLVYLGPHHSESEGEHTLEDDVVRRMIESIELDDETTSSLIRVVDEAFDHFQGFIDEMHDLARSRSRPESSG